MSDNSMLMPPGGSASQSSRPMRPGRPGRALLSAVLILAGSVVIGLVGGAIWAAAAPRVAYQVASMHPPTAYATNPETSAFIAADGWYCVIALAGGALIGLLGYLVGVRRYGPGPMVAVVVGSVAAAFIAAWLGHQLSGGPGFDHVLATSRIGVLLHAPISLGAHGALAFWPLGAAGVAGGIELVGVLRVRRQEPYGGLPMPGMESFRTRPFPTQPGRSQPGLGPDPAPFGPDAYGSGGQEQQDSGPGQGGR